MIRALIIDLEDILKKQGSNIVSDLKESVPVAEGKLRDSISSDVTTDGSVVSLTVSAADHLRFVELGRKRGKFPPLEAIRRWTQAKGIPVRAAFPIARSIAEKGIAPKHVLRDTIARRQPFIEDAVRRAFGDQVRISAEEALKRFVEKK